MIKPQAVLLLNLAILVANFALSYGSSETQIRVMRTAARTAYSAPVQKPAAPAHRSVIPDVRLAKYLSKLPAFHRLTREQIAALFGCLDYCCDALAGEARRLRQRDCDRERVAALRDRLRQDVARTLESYAIGGEQLRSQLVRIVLSSAG